MGKNKQFVPQLKTDNRNDVELVAAASKECTVLEKRAGKWNGRRERERGGGGATVPTNALSHPLHPTMCSRCGLCKQPKEQGGVFPGCYTWCRPPL